jgi:hypothetical protein
LGDLALNGRMLLKWSLKIQDVKVWTQFITSSGCGLEGGSCEGDNEPPNVTKSKEFLWLNKLLKDFIPWN